MGRGKDSAAEERLGRTITRCLDGDSSDEKWNEKIHSVAVNGHQTMKTTHNNQQKTQGRDGWGLGKDARPDGWRVR
jgi:hypothetical protein